MNTKRLSITLLIVGLAVFALALVMQGVQPTMAQDDAPDPLGEPGTFLTGYYDAWVNSPHARFEDEAFQHWNEDGEIETACATCHSTPGYLDFLGADGTEMGVVDSPAPLGTVVNCNACHNSVSSHLTSVTFPSGVTLENLEDSSRCMVCHQGRASTVSVNSAIEEAGLVGEPNTVGEELGFINIHYYAAAASLYGSEVHGGYEYDGKRYVGQNLHVEGYQTCGECHNPHTLQLSVEDCATCHEGVETVEDLRGIRMAGSLADYDGDGDTEEGVAGEIETLQEMLMATIQVYASEVVGTPIGYNSASYPYFFVDGNDDGEIGEDEAAYPNRYTAFTPALLRATYNYQVSRKDPGGYAHNPEYHIQLLYDSIEDLNAQIETDAPVDLSAAQRNSIGHFNTAHEAFRHWDEDGEVGASCTKCHTAEGLPFFLENGATIAFEPSNSLSCETCHNDLVEFTIYPVMEVEFPSGAVLSYGEESSSNMCLECHQGRQSTVSVNAAIASAGVGDDEVSETLGFQNPHYFATGAAWFGTEAQGAYEFEGKEYNSEYEHTRRFDECADCHSVHKLEVRAEECTECHEEVETVEDLRLIRAHPEDAERFDYDGDGDMDEPLAEEIAPFREDLLALIKTYAAEEVGTPILYSDSSYPYWFVDTNGNGEIDEGEAVRDNAYNQWTPNLLRAAYNYTFVTSVPGSYVHNADYIMQVLYDTLEALGGEEAVDGYMRPFVDYYE